MTTEEKKQKIYQFFLDNISDENWLITQNEEYTKFTYTNKPNYCFIFYIFKRNKRFCIFYNNCKLADETTAGDIEKEIIDKMKITIANSGKKELENDINTAYSSLFPTT